MSNKQQAEYQQEETLKNDLRRLSEAGLEPERDLWLDLEMEAKRKVVHKNQYTAERLMAVAAALLVGLALTWSFTAPVLQPIEGFAAPRSSSDLPSESSPALQAVFASYAMEREVLLERVAEELGNYPPEVRSEIRQSINVIETEMKEIETSLARLPVDPTTEMRLADLYEMELRLLSLVSERLRGAGGVS